MNVAAVIYILGIAYTLGFHEHSVSDTFEEQPLVIAFAIILNVFAVLVGPFLIVARLMRDEYAEQLWHKTASTMIPVLVIVPIATFIFVSLAYAIIGGDEPPAWLAWLFEETPIYTAIRLSGSYLIATFLVIFQFLRWKDSR
ncbi:hypothetical protein D6201_03290 [Aurantiacibacter aquimixticola]|uniref:Uncharacterized protein n=2 Tax=Aurantiacibacter aquimixticola TaxID=1958945 RepID=A0A419RRT2_9SPHN|nr:hypothetical protein D6201_03290 [Aurantiacibacter aquimixticola]